MAVDTMNVIERIEELHNAKDRCLAYLEVILYLKSFRDNILFPPESINWKQEMNISIVTSIKKDINNAIERLSELLEVNMGQYER